MSALLARTGRHRQRYENDFRLVAGCIPYRLKENEDNLTGDLENRLEVLMISSPNRLDLVFPKGGWEDDESVGEAACREALEEAGVRGRLDLNVGEAFELCRYEWMRRALEAFLRYLSDECKRRTREDAVAVAVEVAEHSIVAPSCFVNASTPSASTNPINALC